MATVSTVTINLIARTAAFNRRMKGARRSFSAIAGSIRKTQRLFTGFATSLLAGGGIVFALRSVVKTASDSIETLNKFRGVFKTLSRDAEAWANNFAKSTGRARQDVLRWMATLQDTFVPLGFAREKAADFSKELVKLAVDVASFQNEQDQTVIENFTSALVGQTRAVLKYGIVTNVAALEQEALNQGITKGFKNLTNLEKVMLRMNVIFRSTKDAQGDVARTTNDWANQMKRLQANVTTIKELLGSKFIERFNDSLIGLNKSLQNVGESNVDTALNIGKAVGQFTALAVAVNFAVKALTRLAAAQKGLSVAGAAIGALTFLNPISVLLVTAGTALAALTILIDRLNAAEAAAITNASKGIAKRGEFAAKIIRDRAAAERAAQPRGELAPTLRSNLDARRRGEELTKLAIKQERINAIQDDARAKIESLLSPTERFRKELLSLKEMLDLGLLSWKFYTRGVFQARKELERNMDLQKQFDSISEARSVGEFKEITSPEVSVAGLSIGSVGPDRSIQTAILDENRKQNESLSRIADREPLSQTG